MEVELLELARDFRGETRQLADIASDAGRRRPLSERIGEIGRGNGQLLRMDAREVPRRRALRHVVGEESALGRERSDLIGIAFQRMAIDRAAVAAGQRGDEECNGAGAFQFVLMKLIDPFTSTIAHSASVMRSRCALFERYESVIDESSRRPITQITEPSCSAALRSKRVRVR